MILKVKKIQNTGDTGLRPSGNWNGPKRATPKSIVKFSPAGMAPLGISSLKLLDLSLYQTLLLLFSALICIGVM
ncbi:hypothetical protein GBAR_LOCUS3211 [Geodia barretti]|uniref:Uncharacterized protein n=1 Tax=Geodia barretti TaxID=519541 RepID=A0AA35R332_GEOBA|nr:hypothetical protein GBAR_LOCUS3211 [Geodia barretti]